ncbi:phosphoribosyl-AMP cyclohydrolase [Methanosphaera sp. WGK6]|uniref:phosphoribosyl-AMP cyclohydrolase n=1 Tax=Methanosphaera sp. WGK6 TaxID=1561964 RepID=UPI000A45BEC0
MIKPNFRHEINGKQLAICIAQDYKTGQVLMVAYIDEEAFNKTIETHKAHYYSTSRNKIWFKGEESGHIQNVKEILIDCDEDAILLKVEQKGGACHTGHYSCFYKQVTPNASKIIEIEDTLFNPDNVYNH